MITNVFKISNIKENVVCPPKQVFSKLDFLYMLTIGGNIASSEFEYQKLMNCLREFGETDFFILENWGATLTDRKSPFYARISVSSNFLDFKNIVNQFDPPFGFHINNFFVYGHNDNWGIYLCECPTMNIIGCAKEYANDFRKVFGIIGNGFENLDEFISKEYESMPDLKMQLIKNYHLKN